MPSLVLARAYAALVVPALSSFTLALGAAGCATAGGGGGGGGPVDVTQFPSRDALADVASRQLPVRKPEIRVETSSWTLSGPFPDRFGDAPVQPGGINAPILAAVGAARTSESLQCAARELGRFLLAHDGRGPDPRLHSYILARCALTSSQVGWQALRWSDVDKSIQDDAIWSRAEAKAQLTEMINGIAGGGARDSRLGIAFVRDVKAGKALVLVVIDGALPARIDAAPQLVAADATSVVIAGVLEAHESTRAIGADTEILWARAGKGLLGATECAPDLSVVLPRFRFTCPLDAADASARIDVIARRKGRVLGDGVAELLVVRDPAAALEYREPVYTDAAAVDAGAANDRAAALLASINRVRAAAGARPLRNTAAQSAAATKVAGHYFANVLGDAPDPSVSDVVALGLLAGWDVNELVIHDAGFASLLDVSGGGDDLLGSALDHPSFRSVLLDPAASAAAVAPVDVGGGAIGALVVTYEELVPPDHKRAADDVFAKLQKLRTERRLGQTGLIPTEDIMLEAAQALQSGGDIGAAADKALKASVERMRRGFTIWMFTLHDVEHMTFPAQLLQAKTTYVAVAVATRKLPKSAWGATVVLVLGFVEEGQVAALDAPAPGAIGMDAE